MFRSREAIDLAVGLCLIGITFAGCSSSGPETGLIKGQVTLKGQPLTMGSVYFYAPATGFSAGSDVAADGTFTLQEPLPVGAYRVSVLPPVPAETGETAAKPVAAAVSIPKQYLSETSTPLEVVVKEGENSFPLSLE